MFALRATAFEILDGFEKNDYAHSMKNLITFTTDRSY
jgi:hypothetical protein